MGYTFPHHTTTKQQLVDELLGRFFDPKGVTILDHRVKGNNLWVLIDWHGRNGKMIWLFRMEKTNKQSLFGDKRAKALWGYNAMIEADGPLYYDCPKKFFKQAPEPANARPDHMGTGKTWRQVAMGGELLQYRFRC
jgi:hypothetical protein